MPFFSTRHRRVRAVLSAFLLLATLAACSVTVDGTASRAGAGTTTAGAGNGSVVTQPSPTAASSAAATATQSAPVPAGLESFYHQQLSWGSCQDFSRDDSTKELYAKSTFQCAYLVVVKDSSWPNRARMKAGVLKVRATGMYRIGSLWMHP